MAKKYRIEETCEYPLFTMTDKKIYEACQMYPIPVKEEYDDGFGGGYDYPEDYEQRVTHNNWRLTYKNGKVVEVPFLGCRDNYGDFVTEEAFDDYEKKLSIVKYNPNAKISYAHWRDNRLSSVCCKLLGTGLVSITNINTGEVIFSNPYAQTKMPLIEQAIKIFGLYDVYKDLNSRFDDEFFGDNDKYWETNVSSRSGKQRHADHEKQLGKCKELISNILLEDGAQSVDKSKKAEWEKFVKQNMSKDGFDFAETVYTYAFVKELDGAKNFESAKTLFFDMAPDMEYASWKVLKNVEKFSKNGAEFVAKLQSQIGDGEIERE